MTTLHGRHASDGGPSQVDGRDGVGHLLERYAATTAITASADVVRRFHERLAHEPASAPPRRFLAALGRLEPGEAWRAFRQSVAAALGRRRTSPLVRLQSVVLTLAVVVALGAAAGGGGLIGVKLVGPPVRAVTGHPRTPVASPSPSASPSPVVTSSLGESPAPSPALSLSPSAYSGLLEAPRPAHAPQASDTIRSAGDASRAVRQPRHHHRRHHPQHHHVSPLRRPRPLRGPSQS